ncbi:MAG: hypothetical protein ACLTYW_08725 [Collinsella sp.]
MLGRTSASSRCSWSAACSPISSAGAEPAVYLLLLLVLPQYKISLPSFWMLTLLSRSLRPACSPRSSVPASTPCRAAGRGRPGARSLQS